MFGDTNSFFEACSRAIFAIFWFCSPIYLYFCLVESVCGQMAVAV
jgi:hypothetical protein